MACLALLAASACGTGAVEVDGPARGPAACADLLSALPATVDGRPRRDVEPPDALAAAWGDPAIVLRCGVPEPPALTAASPCAEVNGVGWFAEQRADGYRFTTIGRSTNVAVQVPYEYQPAADALVDLASAVRRTVPERDPCV
ncbi:MAG: DUF3515 domain-containing protein [Actinomycetota bacterium]|nr:DUF3515 domain-containing protein [Actinomycetota bacterium]